MLKLLLATSALTWAAAAGAQTPPVGSTTDSMMQPATGEVMPPTSSPMDPSMTDQSRTPDRTADPVDEPTTREGAMPATSATPRARTMPTARSPQPTPMAAGSSAGMGDYPVCSATVTDRCVNPSDIRRGIAKRPRRR